MREIGGEQLRDVTASYLSGSNEFVLETVTAIDGVLDVHKLVDNSKAFEFKDNGESVRLTNSKVLLVLMEKFSTVDDLSGIRELVS